MSKKYKKICIIHYKGMEDYFEIKALSSTNEERIRAAKTKREILKGDNHHQTQCKNIPEIITEDHGIHMSPCYKKFTQIRRKMKTLAGQLGRQEGIQITAVQLWFTLMYVVFVKRDQQNIKERKFF